MQGNEYKITKMWRLLSWHAFGRSKWVMSVATFNLGLYWGKTMYPIVKLVGHAIRIYKNSEFLYRFLKEIIINK